MGICHASRLTCPDDRLGLDQHHAWRAQKYRHTLHTMKFVWDVPRRNLT